MGPTYNIILICGQWYGGLKNAPFKVVNCPIASEFCLYYKKETQAKKENSIFVKTTVRERERERENTPFKFVRQSEPF